MIFLSVFFFSSRGKKEKEKKKAEIASSSTVVFLIGLYTIFHSKLWDLFKNSSSAAHFSSVLFRDNRSSYLDINSINSFLIASASNLLEPIWNAGERFLLALFIPSSLSLQSQTGLPTFPITKMNLFITSLFHIYLIESNDLKSITVFLFVCCVALRVFCCFAFEWNG